MDPTPPTSPEDKQPERSVQEQLDELLVAIEKQEPGTLDPSLLPDAYRKELEQAKPSTPAPTPESAVDDAQDDVADVLAELEQTLDTKETTEEEQAPAEVLEGVLAEAEQAPATDPEADMLASVNAALQGLNPDQEPSDGPTDDELEPASALEPQAEPEPATDPAPLSKTEEELQDEINALLNSVPDQADEPAANEQDEAAAAGPPVESEQASEQERIAEEIEGLLDASQDASQQQTPTIDDLDQMLANEVDIDGELDDDLLGDFQSVQDVTAGIKIQEQGQSDTNDDEHAATARDVAAELDSQPELQPAETQPPAEPGEDTLGVSAEIAQVSAKNQIENEEQAAPEEKQARESQPIDWIEKLQTAADRLLRACFILNWPARRFLSTEWRANLGYLALIHLFMGVAMWLYLIVR